MNEVLWCMYSHIQVRWPVVCSAKNNNKKKTQHTHTHKHRQTRTHTRTHKDRHAYTHRERHTHIRIHVHTHTLALPSLEVLCEIRTTIHPGLSVVLPLWHLSQPRCQSVTSAVLTTTLLQILFSKNLHNDPSPYPPTHTHTHTHPHTHTQKQPPSSR